MMIQTVQYVTGKKHVTLKIMVIQTNGQERYKNQASGASSQQNQQRACQMCTTQSEGTPTQVRDTQSVGFIREIHRSGKVLIKPAKFSLNSQQNSA